MPLVTPLPLAVFDVTMTVRKPGQAEHVARVALDEVPTREEWLRHAQRMYDPLDAGREEPTR